MDDFPTRLGHVSRGVAMGTGNIEPGQTGGGSTQGGLSSEKREDIWSILLAAAVLLAAIAAPEQVYHLFKEALYLF
ncbi:MAG: hypothetical protein PVF51_14485 [Nitrospirota bacterium]